MYYTNDEVRVVSNGELKKEFFTITTVSDDEESFSVTNGNETLTVDREQIMDSWEMDKLAIALIKDSVVEVDEYEEDEDEEETYYSDSTIDGLASYLNSFSTLDELYEWWNRSVYVVQFDTTNQMYHLITKDY